MKLATIKDVKVGAKLKRFYSTDNPNNLSFEIKAIVDKSMYVCKTWLTHKQRWHYFIEHYSWFEVFLPYLYLR
jgi:hypothetical protein